MHRKKSVFWIQVTATIIGMIVLGALLLFCAYLLPTGRMKSHIAESDETFNYEGIYPMIIQGYKCTQLDNYTDGLMYTTAIYPGSGDTLRDMLENPRIEYDDVNMVQGMNDYANDVQGRESHKYEITYGRYWHGYLVILKTLLLFLNVSEIRMLNLMMQGTLFCILLYLVRKRIGAVYQIPLLLMEAVLKPIVLPLSLQYSWVYYVGILSAIVFLIKEQWQSKSIFLLFLVTGMITSYVDLLTYPLITLGLPMMVFLLRWQKKDGTWRKKLLYFMGNSMFWGIGYAVMWGSKWILNSIFTNGNIFENVRTEIEIRLSNTGEAQEIFTAGMVLQKNYDVIKQFPFQLLWIAFLIFVVVYYIVEKRRKKIEKINSNQLLNVLPWLGLSIIPLAWIAVMGNHSWVHYWFTYRELSVTVLGLSCFLLQLLPNTKRCGMMDRDS